MKSSSIRKGEGIALIIVMIAVTVLSILAAAFAFSMKVETRLAQNANAKTELIWLGRSGVEFARWVLARQLEVPNEPYDALNQVWAGGPGGMGTSNSVLAGVTLKDRPCGDGFYSVSITNLESRYNINVADQSVLEAAMRLAGIDAGDTTAIAASIQDWIDPDDSTHVGGTESDHYQSLTPPYYAKNRPMDDISELRFVRGMTTELYDRLGALFTPFSNGRININTANQLTLQLIPFVDESVAAKIVELRAGIDGAEGTEDDMPAGMPGVTVQNVLLSAGLNRGVVQLAERYCTVRGTTTTWEVTVEARIAGCRQRFHAILGRVSPKDVQVLRFYWPEEGAEGPAETSESNLSSAR